MFGPCLREAGLDAAVLEGSRVGLRWFEKAHLLSLAGWLLEVMSYASQVYSSFSCQGRGVPGGGVRICDDGKTAEP